jgi:hypothetical protein
MSVDLKKVNMGKFNLFVYAIAIIASSYNIYTSPDLFCKTGWLCSAIWAFNAFMLQFEVNRLKRENDEEE